MIKHQYKKLLVAIFFFVSSLSYAEISDQSINKLLDLSGLTMQIDQLPALVKTIFEQAKQENTSILDAEYRLMVTSFNESISPSEIVGAIRANLKKSINEKEAQKLLAWYQSNLGKKITRAEKNASTPRGYRYMMQLEQSLLSNQKRVAFANRFDVLTGTTDMAIRLQKHTNITLYSKIMTAIKPDTPLNIKEVKTKTASVLTRAAVKKMVTLSFVYSYRNIETGKLKKYEAFLNDVTTMKFNKTIMDSMSREFESSVSKWADILAKKLKSKKY